MEITSKQYLDLAKLKSGAHITYHSYKQCIIVINIMIMTTNNNLVDNTTTNLDEPCRRGCLQVLALKGRYKKMICLNQSLVEEASAQDGISIVYGRARVHKRLEANNVTHKIFANTNISSLTNSRYFHKHYFAYFSYNSEIV